MNLNPNAKNNTHLKGNSNFNSTLRRFCGCFELYIAKILIFTYCKHTVHWDRYMQVIFTVTDIVQEYLKKITYQIIICAHKRWTREIIFSLTCSASYLDKFIIITLNLGNGERKTNPNKFFVSAKLLLRAMYKVST